MEPNPQLDGERAYDDEAMQTYTYTVRPNPGPQTFTERTLALRNATDAMLNVNLQYATVENGEVRWYPLENVSLEPGQSMEPRGKNGLRIRSSEIRFMAEGAERRYRRFGPESLWLVQETSGQRAYQADRIGQFLYVFESGAKGDSPESTQAVEPDGRTPAPASRPGSPQPKPTPGGTLTGAINAYPRPRPASLPASSVQVPIGAGTTLQPALPLAEPDVTVFGQPDELRVPKIKRETVRIAAERIQRMGLKVGSVSKKLFASDEVTDSSPPESQWVASQTTVRLTVMRQVPVVKDRPFREAEAELKAKELILATPPETQFSVEDWVTAQLPEPKSMVPVGSEVRIQLGAVVPKVEGEALAQAQAILAKSRLQWGFEGNHTQHKHALVLKQTPRPGTVLDHRKKVQLDVVVPVPNVTRRTSLEARVIVKSFDLTPRFAIEQPLADDIVSGQQVTEKFAIPGRAGQEYARPGTVITLDPLLRKVPNVTRQRWETAVQVLREQYHFRVVAPAASPTDVVFSQKPVAGNCVDLRTPIEIVPGVEVPPVAGASAAEAADRIRQRGLVATSGSMQTLPTTEESKTNLVIASKTNPPANALVPRGSQIAVDFVRYVAVQVPALVGKSLEGAQAELGRSGIDPRALKALNSPNGAKVQSQQPPAGTPFRPGMQILVVFPASQGVVSVPHGANVFGLRHNPDHDDCEAIVAVLNANGSRLKAWLTYTNHRQPPRWQFLGEFSWDGQIYAMNPQSPYRVLQIPASHEGMGACVVNGHTKQMAFSGRPPAGFPAPLPF